MVMPTRRRGSDSSQTNGNVTINDPNNRVWVMQTSTNLSSWTEIGAWKVFNGNFHLNVGNAPTNSGVFWRATYDPSRQIIADTVAAALLLPTTPYDYTPTLPTYFRAPPIANTDNTPSTNPITDIGAG